jgi:DNA-binding response OmpR family regulator
MDVSRLEVRRDGQRVELTRREFALTQVLMERVGRIVRRDAIERSIYGAESDVGPNALEVLIHALRRKLGVEVIRTVRGFGYMIPADGA